MFKCDVLQKKYKYLSQNMYKIMIVIINSLDTVKYNNCTLKKIISSMVSSNCALTSQTNVCSSSLTITCSCLNKKSTNVKVFHGSLLILAWILLRLLN